MINWISIIAQSVNTPDGTYNTGLPGVAASSSNIQLILQIVFGVVGGMALIIIMISALRFVLSGGDSQGVTQARNTLIYAVIGLAIAVSAEVIVTFVLNNV